MLRFARSEPESHGQTHPLNAWWSAARKASTSALGIRLLTDRWPLTASRTKPGAVHVPDLELIQEFETLARSDSSGLVRLALASTLQRIPVRVALAIARPWSRGKRMRRMRNFL